MMKAQVAAVVPVTWAFVVERAGAGPICALA
jgi:hypothetical protein